MPISQIPQQSTSGIIIANPNPININLTNPIGVTLPSQFDVSVKNPISIVNSNSKPLDINITNPKPVASNWDTFKDVAGALGSAAGAVGIVLAGVQAYRAEKNVQESRRKDDARFAMEQDLYRQKTANRTVKAQLAIVVLQLTKRERQVYDDLTSGPQIKTKQVNTYFGYNVIEGDQSPNEKKLKIAYALQRQSAGLEPIEEKDAAAAAAPVAAAAAAPAAAAATPAPAPVAAAAAPGQGAAGRKRTKKKGRGRKIKKSTNLDAQILRLLKS
jgi:hypothetical protein